MALDLEKFRATVVNLFADWVEMMPKGEQTQPIIGLADESEELTPQLILEHVRRGTDLGDELITNAMALGGLSGLQAMVKGSRDG